MSEMNSDNLKVIAEYGQEYGKENPICVVYNGYGHYDALHNPTSTKKSKSVRNLSSFYICFIIRLFYIRTLYVFVCVIH